MTNSSNVLDVVGRLNQRVGELEAENNRLKSALNEIMPRYVELYEAAGLGDPGQSVAVEIAQTAFASPAAGGQTIQEGT